MTKVVPKLREEIDIMPSPAPDQPGLLLRDPYRFSSTMLIIPPVLVPALTYFDGQRTYLDLQAYLCRRTGQLVEDEVVENLVGTLQEQGFLETEEFYQLREARHAEFRNSPTRQAIHAGSAYPGNPELLGKQLAGYFQAAPKQPDPPGLLGVAAPHVSPAGGWQCYADAYAQLTPELGEKTFVLLGTSHYGQPEKFGLTCKPFVTPLGTLPVDTGLVDWLAEQAGEAVEVEDYCHAIEHSIEFQCVYLQYAVRANVRILPILCGPFQESLVTGQPPEANPSVHRFFQTLGELAVREASRLFWILGIDLAHIGRRYGDPFAAQAEQGRMVSVRQQDAERLERICAGDSQGFFDLLHPGQDRLRWCGYSPLYTFLKAVPGVRAGVLNYQQWNIDAESVVSFAALGFSQQ